MRAKLSRKLLREQKKLMLPTQIAIAICALFFAVALLVSPLMGVIYAQDRTPKWGVASDILLPITQEDASEQQASSPEIQNRFEFIEKVIQAAKERGARGVFVDEGLSLSLTRTDAADESGYLSRVYWAPENEAFSPFKIREGRLTQSDQEIVLESALLRQLKLHVGDQVSVANWIYTEEGGVRRGAVEMTIVGETEGVEQSFSYDAGLVLPSRLEAFRQAERAFDREKREAFAKAAAVAEGGERKETSAGSDARAGSDAKTPDLTQDEDPLPPIYLYANRWQESDREQLKEVFASSYKLLDRAAFFDREFKHFIEGEAFNPVLMFALLFVLVSIGVACLVVSNTFQVLVERRRQTLALMRTIGAQKAEVYRWVIKDAARVGLIASLLGAWPLLIFVEVLGHLHVRVSKYILLPMVSPWFFIWPPLILTLATIFSVLPSARAATAVHPIEALRPVELSVHGKSKKRFHIFSSIFAFLSIVGILGTCVQVQMLRARLVGGAYTGDLAGELGLVIVIGIFSCFLLFGVMIALSRYWMPALLRLFKVLFSKASVELKLASVNIQKNPRRASVTGCALFIGVTIIVAFLTGASSAKATMNNVFNRHFVLDIQLEGKDLAALSDELRDRTDLFEAVVQIPRAATQVSARQDQEALEARVYRLDADETASVLHHKLPRLAPNEVIVGTSLLKELTSMGEFENSDAVHEVYLPNASGVLEKFVLRKDSESKLFADYWRDALVLSPDANLLFPSEDRSEELWLRVNPKARLVQVQDKLNDLVQKDGLAQATSGSYILRATYTKVVDSILIFVFFLTGIAVLIALIGLGNTLILAVLERKREIATLRVIGMTQKQLSQSLIAESILLGFLGILSGMIAGISFGMLGSHYLLSLMALDAMRYALSLWGLIAVFVVGLICCTLAGLMPMRIASKTSPIEAMQEA